MGLANHAASLAHAGVCIVHVCDVLSTKLGFGLAHVLVGFVGGGGEIE